jgi:hypothetical protein
MHSEFTMQTDYAFAAEGKVWSFLVRNSAGAIVAASYETFKTQRAAISEATKVTKYLSRATLVQAIQRSLPEYSSLI